MAWNPIPNAFKNVVARAKAIYEKFVGHELKVAPKEVRMLPASAPERVKP